MDILTLLIIIVISVIVVNYHLVCLILTSPVLYILSHKRIGDLKQKSLNNNGSEIKEPKNLIDPLISIKLLIGSYHSRLALKWLSEIPSHRIRRFFYSKVYLVQMADKSILYYGAEIRSPWNLKIGTGSIIGDRAILDASEGINIGENVNLSSGVSVYTLQHDYRDSEFKCTPAHYGPVNIGNRVWIGPSVIILPNVTIGEGAVVGAGAVVTRDIPPFELWGGIPAKKIGERPTNMNYIFNGFHPDFL